MEDLPPKLAKEWGRWCANKDFFSEKFSKEKPELAAIEPLIFLFRFYRRR